ncbi:MAG: NADPH-dependent FMN reductase [Parvibaculum sp.]|nr:NADPH-dependent FMN reductase [Parvibaculum sp.]
MRTFLAICGSLRRSSSNKSLLEAAALLAPDGVTISLYEGMGELPAFNPDIADDAQPASVTDFRAALGRADAVIISTPEYVHSLPGSLKNALDWLVGTSDLVDKPVTLFNASPRSTYAVAALNEILTVMSGRVVDDASITLQLSGRDLDAAGIVAEPPFSAEIRRGIATLLKAVEA